MHILLGISVLGKLIVREVPKMLLSSRTCRSCDVVMSWATLAWFEHMPCAGLDPEQADKQPFIASMGIYVFKKNVLVDLLKKKYPGSNDFGGEIIPMAAAEGQKVIAYLFNDYWEDIGTIKSFFDANLALAQTVRQLAVHTPLACASYLLSVTAGRSQALNAAAAVGKT